jgi:hypothetical protein
MLLGRLQWAAVVDFGRVVRFPFMFRKLLYIQIISEAPPVLFLVLTCAPKENRYNPAQKKTKSRVAGICSPHPVSFPIAKSQAT